MHDNSEKKKSVGKHILLSFDGTGFNIGDNSSVAKFHKNFRADEIHIEEDEGAPGSASITRIHNKDYWRGYNLVLISVKVKENITKIAEKASSKHDNAPVLIKHKNWIYIYGFSTTHNKWMSTKLHESLQNIVEFPDPSTLDSLKTVVKTSSQLNKQVYDEIQLNNGHSPPPNHTEKVYFPGIGSESDNTYTCPGENSTVLNKDKAAINEEINRLLTAEEKRQKNELEKLSQELLLKHEEKNDQHQKKSEELKKPRLNPEIIYDFYGTSYPVINPFNKFYRAIIKGEGREENVNKATTIIANGNYEAITINGWSRGGITAIHLANKLFDLGYTTPIHLFLIDPVAGLLDGLKDPRTQNLPPNIIKCTILLATGDESKEFHPQSFEDGRLKVNFYEPETKSNVKIKDDDEKKENPTQKLQLNVFPVHGTHSQVAGIDNNYDIVLLNVLKNKSLADIRKQAAQVSAEHNKAPVLIKKGRMVYIFGDSNNNGDQLIQLNGRIRFWIDFPHITEGPQLKTKNQIDSRIYHEITSKNAHTPVPTQITEYHLANFIAEVESKGTKVTDEGAKKTMDLLGVEKANGIIKKPAKLIELYACTQVGTDKYKYKLGPMERIVYTKEARPFTQNLELYTPRPNEFINRHHQQLFWEQYPELYSKIISNQVPLKFLLDPELAEAEEKQHFASRFRLVNRIITNNLSITYDESLASNDSREYKSPKDKSEMEIIKQDKPYLYEKLITGEVKRDDILSPECKQLKKLDINSRKVLISCVLLRQLDKQILEIPKTPIYKNFKASLLELRESAQKEIFTHLQSLPKGKPAPAHKPIDPKNLRTLPGVVECRRAAKMTKVIISNRKTSQKKYHAINKYASNRKLKDYFCMAATKVTVAALVIVAIPIVFISFCFTGPFVARALTKKITTVGKNINRFFQPKVIKEANELVKQGNGKKFNKNYVSSPSKTLIV